MTEHHSSDEVATFLDGTLNYGSLVGQRCGDPRVISISDPSEGQEILCSVGEARALKLWLELMLSPVEEAVSAPKVEA